LRDAAKSVTWGAIDPTTLTEYVPNVGWVFLRSSFEMSNFNTATDKHQAHAEANCRGGVTIKVVPRDYKATGAAEVDISRTRNDDGSVTIDVQPK
jgi:hypothetical protein